MHDDSINVCFKKIYVLFTADVYMGNLGVNISLGEN